MKRTTKITEEEFDDKGNLVKRVVTEEIEDDAKPWVPNTSPTTPWYPNRIGNPGLPYPIITHNESASSGNFKTYFDPKEESESEDKATYPTLKDEDLRDKVLGQVQKWFDTEYNNKVR